MTTSIHDNNSTISAMDISYFHYPTRDLLKMLGTSVENRESRYSQTTSTLNVKNDIPGISL